MRLGQGEGQHLAVGPVHAEPALLVAAAAHEKQLVVWQLARLELVLAAGTLVGQLVEICGGELLGAGPLVGRTSDAHRIQGRRLVQARVVELVLLD